MSRTRKIPCPPHKFGPHAHTTRQAALPVLSPARSAVPSYFGFPPCLTPPRAGLSARIAGSDREPIRTRWPQSHRFGSQSSTGSRAGQAVRAWDTAPHGIPRRVGYRAAWDTAPRGIPRRVGYRALRFVPVSLVCLFARSRLRVAVAAHLGELVPEGGQGRTMGTRTTGKTQWSRRSPGSCSAGTPPYTAAHGDVSQQGSLPLGMIQAAPNR
jgi:hypothetical protein